MPSHNQSFNMRNVTNVAEEKCLEYFKENKITYTRYGFDCIKEISGKDFMKIPHKLRATPDYMIFGKSAHLLEVKGCYDLLRLKLDDMKAYNFWQTLANLYIFVYSTKVDSHKIVPFSKLVDVSGQCKIDYYEDNGKAYYKIPWEVI